MMRSASAGFDPSVLTDPDTGEPIGGCIPLDLAASLSGMEVYQKMIDGEILPPPIYALMRIKLVHCEPGHTRFEGTPTFSHYNPIGHVHGGWTATMLDAGMASCIHTKLPVGMGFATVEFKVNILRRTTEHSGMLQCEGRVLHFGGTIATSEARITDSEGRLVAHGVETCSVFPIGH